VQSHQVAGDAQAQAGAAKLAGGAGIGLRKVFENSHQLVHRNADARVRYLKAQGYVARRGRLGREARPHHHAALAGEFQRVADQVDQYLLQAHGVAPTMAAGTSSATSTRRPLLSAA